MTNLTPSSTSTSTSTSTEENTDERSHSFTIISLVYKNGRIGAAIYRAEEPDTLSLMEEQSELSDYLTTRELIEKENPSLVIYPGRINIEFADFIVKLADGQLSDSFAIKAGFNNEFKHSTLTNALILDEDEVTRNPLSISAGSAIMGEIKKDAGLNPPSKINWFSRSFFMTINKNVLLSLQIISNESHPNMHFTDRFDGLSLMRIMSNCHSFPGRSMLKDWILKPLKDRVMIERRLELVDSVIENLIRKGHLNNLQRFFKKIQNINRALTSFASQPSLYDFKILQKFLKSVIQIKKIFKTQINQLDRILGDISEELLVELFNMVEGVVDIDQSDNLDRIVIRSNVNPELDNLRQKYHSLPEFLGEVVQKIAQKLSEDDGVKKINVVYFPQLGFLVTIPTSDDHVRIQVDEFELQFTTERVTYYKESITRQLDEEIGDVYADIVDMETEIVQVLLEQIRPHIPILRNYSIIVAELDCLICLAKFATENNLVRPILTERTLDIRGGRHILQERVCEQDVVDNDCTMDDVRVAVITGPNGSGKSIYMKQIGLIIFMTHMGSFVPAKSAKVPLIERFFTRIQTRESISSCSSAFHKDLTQINEALKACNEHSILLIDEFGKGTSPNEGIALFSAVIKRFASQGQNSPIVIAITHFHEVYQQSLLSDDLSINWNRMEFLENPDEDERVTFLYKVTQGKSNDSLGIQCAIRAGVPHDVIKRAKELTNLLEADVPPLAIRYASLDEGLEEKSTELVQSLQIMEQIDLLKLKKLANELEQFYKVDR